MWQKSSFLIEKAQNFWEVINCIEIVFPYTQENFSVTSIGTNPTFNKIKINLGGATGFKERAKHLVYSSVFH